MGAHSNRLSTVPRVCFLLGMGGRAKETALRSNGHIACLETLLEVGDTGSHEDCCCVWFSSLAFARFWSFTRKKTSPNSPDVLKSDYVVLLDYMSRKTISRGGGGGAPVRLVQVHLHMNTHEYGFLKLLTSPYCIYSLLANSLTLSCMIVQQQGP